MSKKVSIAMATYNGGKYLREQLDSIVGQTICPDELIICDDGSSDNTVEIVREFSGNSPFKILVVMNDENLGYSQNFSKALGLCTGEYVFLSDQDDVWCPEKIARMLTMFEVNPEAQLLIHDIEFCNEDLSPIGQTKIQRMTGAFDLQKQYVVGMATCVTRRFLEVCLPVPDQVGIAYDTWLHKCASAFNVKTVVHEVLALHRRHSGNETRGLFLNADYVVKPWKLRVKELHDLMLRKETFCTSDNCFLEWLLSSRNILVENGYVDSVALEQVIKNEERVLAVRRDRADISSMGRLERLPSVIKLYRSGGYRHINKWKTMVRDIFLN